MSRIGKKPIAIPEKTEVSVVDGLVSVRGPKGELHLNFRPVVEIKVEEGNVVVVPKDEKLETRALWGTYASEIASMVKGVNENFEKKLIVEGVGYKWAVQGNNVVLNIGFSHPVNIEIPEGITCTIEKDTMTISGPSKEKVGQFAADIRNQKKPEPYKGKGIRYSDEVVRRKEGKKAL
jgi:large subunit ribosomal protein L6